MGEELKKVEEGAKPDESVKTLEEALALEKAKNEVLMEQILKSENALADKDTEGFEDVIPNEDRGFWRGQLLENREAAVGILNRMRERMAPAVKTETAPGAAAVPPVAVPPVAVPKPLHNREAAKPAVAEKGAAGGGDRAAKIRNRAQEIARRDGASFTVAFRAAEMEGRRCWLVPATGERGDLFPEEIDGPVVEQDEVAQRLEDAYVGGVEVE